MDIFDIIGPVMVGPSSSHTAGAVRIGYISQKLMGEQIKEANILLYGSFLDTGKGHGTNKAIVAGLLGMQPGMTTSGSFNLLGNDGRCSLIGVEAGFNNLTAAGSTSTHGNETSFETVVKQNPDYIFVMDRDSAISTAGAKNAKEIVENELVKTTDAYKNNHIIYLEHSNVWYTAEGGIQALDIMLTDLEKGLK